VDVYLVVIGWMYVVLMMSVAEASNSNGTVLGAIVTFFLYGLLPVVLVVYLMRSPQRRQNIRKREAAEAAERLNSVPAPASAGASFAPHADGHAPGAAQPGRVAPVGKEDVRPGDGAPPL
jgi:hypothetical protein